MRLAFMGTPDFSVPVLDALVEAGHEIAAVYSQPPRPAGRGKKLRPSPVHSRAEALGLEVRTPLNFKAEEDRAAFAALDLDAAVVVAYGLILPQAILDAPRLGCVNLHASLLPRWRGAAPIQRAIMAGDAETGVCAMQMEAGLDTGPVILIERTPIGPEDTAGSLHDRLSAIGAGMIDRALTGLADGSLTPQSQAEDGVLYARKIDKAEARIDWTRPAAELDRLIRGLSPFPGAWCDNAGERLKVLLAAPETTSLSAAPGEALDDTLLIACGGTTGIGGAALRLKTLQRAGKGAMSAEDFLRGFPVAAGAKLT
jgi:methionyl-tRNA formyltransferase